MQFGVNVCNMLKMRISWKIKSWENNLLQGSPEVMSCVTRPVALTSLFDDFQTLDVKVTHACRHSLLYEVGTMK